MSSREPEPEAAPPEPAPLPAQHGLKRARVKALIAEAVTEDDIRALARMLAAKAADGDVSAARELLDRLIGKPMQETLITANVATAQVDYSQMSQEELERQAHATGLKEPQNEPGGE